MYSARSLLRPRLSVIYTYPARHLMLFQPADRRGMWCLQGGPRGAPSPALQTAGSGPEHGSLQIFPKNNMIRKGITPKKPQALCLQSTPVRGCHAEHHTVIQTPNRVYSLGFGMGCCIGASHSLVMPGQRVLLWTGSQEARECSQRLQPPLQRLPGRPSRAWGRWGKAEDAERGWGGPGLIRFRAAPCKWGRIDLACKHLAGNKSSP